VGPGGQGRGAEQLDVAAGRDQPGTGESGAGGCQGAEPGGGRNEQQSAEGTVHASLPRLGAMDWCCGSVVVSGTVSRDRGGRRPGARRPRTAPGTARLPG